MKDNVNKISIIGGPGTGKSTLANNIGKELNLPIHHLDGTNYKPNWVQVDKKKRDENILKIADGESWVIDGTYKATLEERIGKSDLVIFLDYSTPAKVKGILSRYIKGRGKEKKEIPGCNEKMDWEFLNHTIHWNKEKRKLINDTLERNSDKEIMIFKNRTKLNKWYKNEFNKEIKV